MTEQPQPRTRFSELKLSAEDQSVVGETIAGLVAINVYRELVSARDAASAAASSCSIIANCCSCSSAESLGILA